MRQTFESESQRGIFENHPNILIIGSSFMNQILNIIHIMVSGDILQGCWLQVCSCSLGGGLIREKGDLTEKVLLFFPTLSC